MLRPAVTLQGEPCLLQGPGWEPQLEVAEPGSQAAVRAPDSGSRAGGVVRSAGAWGCCQILPQVPPRSSSVRGGIAPPPGE